MKNKQKFNGKDIIVINQQKGITLIALVITIIVLLILAGVTLSIVFNGGIIDKSQNAVDKWEVSQENETQKLDYLDKQFGQVSGMLDNTKGTENKKILDTDFAYNNPVIPVGFRTSSEGASWAVRNDEVSGWNDGLVIEDDKGNQFVWVPVDGTKVTYNTHYDKTPAGKGNVASDFTAQSLPNGINDATQVSAYGGFYIARYEAGIPSTMTEAIADISKRDVNGENITPVSKKNQVPWNNISWTNAKSNAEGMYSTNSYYQSVLITEKMWDTTMQWLDNADVDVDKDCRGWGNYWNSPVAGITEYSPYGNFGASWTTTSSRTKPTSGSAQADYMWLLKTGHSDYTKKNNIYDLAGNLWEWTNSLKTDSSSCSIRGGGFYSDGTDHVSTYRGGGTNSGGVGFRPGLLIK